MNWEVVGQIVTAALSVLGGVFLVIKLLLKDNFAKAKTIEELKAKHTSDALKRLEENSAGQQTRLDEFKAELARIIGLFQSNTVETKKMIDMIKVYAQKTEKRFVKIESEQIKLGEDLVMVRSKR